MVLLTGVKRLYRRLSPLFCLKKDEDMKRNFLEELAGAQMVLVGVGKEMEASFSKMQPSPFYQKLLKQANGREDAWAVEQYLRLHYLKRHADEGRKKAYAQLASLLEGKNYFIVSLCTDDYIYDAGLERERIVTPCGGYRALQCAALEGSGHGAAAGRDTAEISEGAAGTELIADSAVWERVLEQIDESEGDLERIAFPVCSTCGSPLAFNQITTPGYKEEGYLPQWEKYKKWLQGTLNRKLCILELGVGMEYPSVIRFPFEKVAFFNQKSCFFRVHGRLYQLTEELKERGTSIHEDALAFLLNGCVQ